MISRRDFLQVGMAASAIIGGSGFGNWARLAAQQALTQDQLLEFDTFGNVSLIHVTDIHAQMKPILEKMRSKTATGKCSACDSYEDCLGGCSARAFAMTGSFDSPDPHCWIEDEKPDLDQDLDLE